MKTLKKIIVILLLIDMILIPISAILYCINIIDTMYIVPGILIWLLLAIGYIAVEYQEDKVRNNRRIKRSGY